MCSDLYLITNCLSFKENRNSRQVKQLHSDAKIHKGTEIINVILCVLTNNKQLRTIYLAGDIIPEDDTAKCQSDAIID